MAVHVVVLEIPNVRPSIVVVVAFTFTMPITVFPLTIVISPLVNNTPDPISFHGLLWWFAPIDGVSAWWVRSSGVIMNGWFLFVGSAGF